MTEEIKVWIANRMDMPLKTVESLLNNEPAVYYLLVWPLFETELCKGFMEKKEISNLARRLAPYFSEIDTENMLHHFYNRYNVENDDGRNQFINLCHGRDRIDFKAKRILKTRLQELKDEDILYLLIFIVFRYRNNIFHGNKAISDWGKYRDQIAYCVRFMMSVLDCYKRHKDDIDKQEAEDRRP